MIQITLVHQAALGDTMLLLPLFRALRERFSEACSITLVTKPNMGQMLTMLGLIERYASADDREHAAWFAPPDSNDAALPSPPDWARGDLLISAVSTGSDPWAAHARLARHGLVSRFPGNGLIYFEPRPPEDFAGHVTQWHRRQLGELDLAEPSPTLPRVNPDGAVLIHPGSGSDAKCWPRDRFISVGRTLKRNGILPTFILGEAEQERWGRAAIDALKDEFPWYLHMGLFELAERMSRARMYLGNDSGVTHVAAAMGIPVIALFGPSNDIQWRPIGPGVTILRAAPPHERSLESLEESAVLDALLAELRKIET